MSTNQGCIPPKMPCHGDYVGVDPDEWFESVRWRNRLLIVEGADEACERQTTLALERKDGFLERDLLVIRLREGDVAVLVGEAPTPPPTSEAFRTRFSMAEDAFEVVLVGKDGGAKERRDSTFETDELFGIIDAMPMRIREMRR